MKPIPFKMSLLLPHGHKFFFYFESCNQKCPYLSVQAWLQDHSAQPSSSVAAYYSSVHQKKKHDKKAVWTVNMGSKTLLAH